MSLLAAVAVFFSTFVSPIVNFFLSGGVYLVGTLFDSFFKTLSESKDVPQALKGVAIVIHLLVPNFQSFNVQNAAVNPGQGIQGEGIMYLNLALYAFTYIAILLIGGIIVFENREV